ncbi:uncharacterized protein LOC116775610 [Danaus plexippus]|uniref:uncharacterized protein LOC116775610 n=1 Tax=Danaus plexippus TaxID=13037 RepID=UPI002AB2A269|nr:uncharacterized protein LOC116775610 [Danaus plexippus]
MSSTSALENNEDLENIPLVRMADVQPDRSSEMYLISNKKVSSYACEDDDCNIGSMVSIQAEEVVEDDGNETELIIPENVERTHDVPMTLIVEKIQSKQNPEHWPTLEILPGGVIKYADKYEEDLTCYQNDVESGCSEMMYACAKCPQRFNYLFSLVKHVKLHEIQKKKEQELELISISLDPSTTHKSMPASPTKMKKQVCTTKNKKKGISKTKSKCKLPKRN